MGNIVTLKTTIEGKDFTIETGRFAAQANGAATARIGDTVVLATVVMGNENPNLDYFPLYVEYEERMYAAGKIKSSRFVKREGRATDEAILTARLVDRGLRPLFPDGFKRETQIIVTVLSYDGKNDPDLASILAASTALMVSDIPFAEPIAGLRIGYVDGKYIACPTKEEQEQSVLDLVVSSKKDGLVMVEAGAKIISEEIILGGIEKAQELSKSLCALQEEMREKAGKEKIEIVAAGKNEALAEAILGIAGSKFGEIYMTKGKVARNIAYKALKAEVEAGLAERFAGLSDDERAHEQKAFSHYLEDLFNDFIRRQILEQSKRFEGRALDEIRSITVETG
jgi:polyribonucleotide nucleotidyltransferase